MGKFWTYHLLVLSMWSVLEAQETNNTFPIHFTQSLYDVSIHENSAAKSYVTCPIKMGIDLMNKSWDIRYTIESGDRDKLFKAEKHVLGNFCFLRIRTTGGNSATLNREVKENYVLTVHSYERLSGSESQTQVNVHVLDTNDLRPLFSPTSYSFFVSENSPIRTSIGRVSATDADKGTNGEYYFSFKEKTDLFSIHPTSGVVILTGKLDYSEAALYEIDVLAVDRGLKLYGSSSCSTAKLKVHVLQDNQHAPVISAVPLTPWNSTADATYVYVTVEDADEGKNGEIGLLRIVAGDPNQHFKVFRSTSDSKEFKIKALKEIDWGSYSFGHNITLQAKDKGSPAKFSSPVTVRVPSPSQAKKKIRFEKQVYRVSLSEFAPPHSPVVMVRTDAKRADVKYVLRYTKHQGESPFVINPNTGLITTVLPLKAELISQYELEVSTNDRQAVSKVVVDVRDMNNNAPKFHKSKYEARIAEHEPIGTSVITVSATDEDDGENGYVTYSIANLNKQPFALDYFTGVISVSEDIDYETMEGVFLLKIRASDWGSPFRRESETVVFISVINLNDNAPQFEKIDCAVTVPRSLKGGEQIIVMSAIDVDDLGVVQYRIDKGNDMDLFELDSDSGAITLKKPLTSGDAVGQFFHFLQITATDGEMSSSPMFVNLTVSSAFKNVFSKCTETGVLRTLPSSFRFGSHLQSKKEPVDEFPDTYSVNHNAPQFLESTPSVIEVKENVPVGTRIALLGADDLDAGFNGELVFVISGGDFDSCFTVESDTGWLKVFQPLDRETTNHYSLNITVYDLGSPQKSSFHLLHIDVLDVNDNPPEFLQDEYFVNISEETSVGTNIIQLKAKDKDSGLNGLVCYSFLTKTEKFIIHEETGIVSVQSDLDRETSPTFVFKVAAFDKADKEPKMMSTVLLHIHLEDVNDNAPIFIPKKYHVKVREDVPVGTMVLWLEAHDPDLGLSGQVKYSLLDDEDKTFRVDKDSGALYLAQSLDFEKKQLYNLVAEAKDRGKPKYLSSSCLIEVEIVDVNENVHHPTFPFFVDSGAVSEDAAVGTSVLKVSAQDEDSGRDGEVFYTLQEGSGLGVFTIDGETGIIRTQAFLDRETFPYYWLTVYATDQGIVPLSTFVEVYIEVQDVNDNAPLTTEAVYYPSIPENSPKDVSVIHIQAFDPDSKSSDNLSYKITSGNPQGFFAINSQTGLVTTTSRKLDREKQAEHLLEVTVSDDGIPFKATAVPVIVKVLDENDNSPQFMEKIFKIKLLERAETVEWEPIYRVIAYDRDESPSSDITYSIEDGDEYQKFSVGPTSGLVFSKEAFSAGDYHNLTIKASDSGQPSKSSICQLHIEWIPKPKMAKQPLAFEDLPLSFSVMENDPAAHMVGVIRVQPLDSPVWFQIKGHTDGKGDFHILQTNCEPNCSAGGNTNNQFGVERASGTIIVARALDAEQQSNYNLTVEATDGTRSISSQVKIHVIDKNEYRPQFDQKQYETNISEGAQPGTKILEIKATDKDKNYKLSYTLLSSTDLFSLKKFRLDPGTGFLYTAEELDHETIHRHILTVMVRDQGDPVKSNVVRVIINVEDRNDNQPWFTKASYVAHVFESAAIGSSVIQVTALDKDKSLNAEVSYSIDSGNHGNFFSIDQHSGLVTSLKEFKQEYRDQFELIIKASDKGEPQLSIATTVQITVTIPDNRRPKFPLSSMSVEVSESAPVGSFVALASASSQSTVYYQIKEGNENRAFKINPNSGAITTRKVLDFETLSNYKLIIQGTDMAQMSSSVAVHIYLKDENDNAPIFTQTEYTGFVSESANLKSVVLTSHNTPLVVRATDADTHSNAGLFFEIVEPFAHNYFTIDSGTGAIQTISSLDFEKRQVFNFRVMVHDTGTPCLFAQKMANVSIHVINVNDCAPKFTQDCFESTLFLPTYKGVHVLAVNATDEDALPDSKMLFEITDGNIGSKFLIDAISGDIFVQNATQLRSRYRLTVQASDGWFTAATVVKINVKQIKNHNLKFTQEAFTAYVQESSSERKTLAVLSVVGNQINQPLFYSILNPDSRFEIGCTSGVLFSTGIPFDREEEDLFEIIVAVTNEPRLNETAHALVRVHVEDVNDNAPVFVDQPYRAVIQTDKPVGSVFKKLVTVDKDFGENGEVTLFMKGHDRYFQVSPSGEISLKKPLDLKSVGNYVMNITAKDGGDPPLFSKAEVFISVANKAAPLFEKPFYQIEIPENVQAHSSILQVVADESAGARTVYSICGGNPFNQFSINFNSGILKSTQLLDYETHPAYRLNIQATDSLTGAYSNVFVDIILEDVNDNPPKFEAGEYNVSISESVVIGTSVVRVVAHDSDTGRNAVLSYKLYEKNRTDSSHFRIDMESGVIQTLSMLDHETTFLYELMVEATDGGLTQQSSVVNVFIYVMDLNESPPAFTQPLYNANLSESYFPGQLVTCVKAFDSDGLGSSQLKYTVLSGNENRMFSIDSTSGEIVMGEIRPHSLEPVYWLTLSVTDGVFRGTAEAKINVIGQNNNSPSFAQDEYLIELTENSPTGTLVTQVHAFDKDPGINGQVAFFIVNDIARDKFTINAKGQIHSVENFDRENSEEKRINISLMAKDGGGRLGFCTVIVMISDVNDNSPKFMLLEYKATVRGDAPKGTTVIKMTALDADEGSNAVIVYSMESDIEHFKINSLSGEIVTKGSLIGLENSVYSFFVKAKDSGSPPKQSVVSVSVKILPLQESLVSFAESSLRIDLSEDQAIGSSFDIFQANTDQPMVYKLVEGNTPQSNLDGTFSIDGKTGQLSLIKRLDYETIQWYLLTVQVHDDENGLGLFSVMDVHIRLEDVNDNRPQFESFPYQSYIVENLPEGTRVVQVKATDLDSRMNGQVTYRLHNNQESPEVFAMFAVDSETGWIYTLTEIDREEKELYRITVVAADRALDLQMTGTTVVEVTVVDTNDNAPVFAESVYKGTVREDAPVPGTVVSNLSISDSDCEEVNKNFDCFITGGDPQGRFDVKHTDGVCLVALFGFLDREERDFYLLNITATDGTFATKATVEIAVLDANDNRPVCRKDVYVQRIPEDVFVGKEVLRVSATDADILTNGEITYQLMGNGAEAFMIDSKTGAVRTLATLDRENTDVYNLVVRATDGGGLFCQSDVVIEVQDVNDNAPNFTSDPHHVSLFENTQPGTYVARSEAFDADIGLNSQIRYSFEDSARGLFAMEETSGIISLEGPLNKLEQAMHVLRVRATDMGSPHRLSSLGSVVVSVLASEDNPAMFEHRDYVSKVPEDTAVGSKLLSVFAASRDRDRPSHVTYSITSGNEAGTFRIDSQTGDIFLSGPLDFEETEHHYLRVRATTRAKQSLSDTATITIHLLDINDNVPVFSQEIYSSTVSEDTRTGTRILTVLANDFDGPLHSQIRYSIKDDNQSSPFILDTNSGDLKVAQRLDRETEDGFTLTVLASDGGNPPKSASATVRIVLSDVNDNPPVFSHTNYSLTIQENLPVGVSVLQLNVTDTDSSPNGPPFSFRILNGNQTSYFLVDQQGVMKTALPLRKGQQIFQVQVSDNGSPRLSSVTSVEVLVTHASVSPPSVLPLDVFVMVPEDEFLGGMLGKIQAADQDEFDTLTFSLDQLSNSLFSVIGTDGRLLTRGGLDVGHYRLNVSVSDGHFSNTGAVTVKVQQVTEHMLDRSVSVRFDGVTPEDFIRNHWRNFQKAVRSLTGVRRGNIHLISLQPAEVHSLDVLLFCERSERAVGSLESVSQKLESSRAVVKEMTGLDVAGVLDSKCSSRECPEGLCRRVVLNQTMATYSSPSVSYVTPRHQMTACPCTEFGEDKLSCTCPGNATGDCSGQSPMTFNGSSYIKYNLSESHGDVKLTFRFKTLSKEGTVMIAKGKGYSILEIINGKLRFQLDCGMGLATVSVHSVLVNDGRWHTAALELQRNFGRLVLDQLHSASGTAPGPLHCLNLSQQVVLGGLAPILSSRFRSNRPPSHGLQGCMDSVVFNGQKLPLHTKDPRGSVTDVVGVSPGCVMAPSPDCSSNPCLNAGSCVMKPSGGYVCKCSSFFSGTHCETRISPCDSNPCLYGGSCFQNNLDFYCKCRGQYTGQRCQIGPYCKENPCQNGGQCIDSLDGPICECEPGFKGDRCTVDVDECVGRPCIHDGLCTNTHGSFNCSCLTGFSGKLCEMTTEPRNQPGSLSRSSWLGELALIVALLVAGFVFIFVFLIIWRGACNLGDPQKDLDSDYSDEDSYIKTSGGYNQVEKVSLDTPPQVPVRPISYTPSLSGNNRGSVSEFSSAASDPLFGLKKTVAVCSVAPNFPLRKNSDSSVNNDSSPSERGLNLSSSSARGKVSFPLHHADRSLEFTEDNTFTV